MKQRMLPIAVAVLVASPLVAAAQQPTRPKRAQDQAAAACPMGMHGMMMGMMPGGMMRPGQVPGRGMMGGPMGGRMNDSSHLAQMRSQLGLSDAQVAELRAIHQRACTAAQPHMRMAMQAHRSAMQTLQGNSPSLDAFRSQLDQAAKHMVAAQVEMAKGMLEFRNGLTPAQRQKLDQMHRQMMWGATDSSAMPAGAPQRSR
ncbi:MAG TPA: periplasmic heavy metal sensor [Gemmatimonadales bacterium]|nr:periplasmic heavy metal sensor [Gemmatimonadales bacterium]